MHTWLHESIGNGMFVYLGHMYGKELHAGRNRSPGSRISPYYLP